MKFFVLTFILFHFSIAMGKVSYYEAKPISVEEQLGWYFPQKPTFPLTKNSIELNYLKNSKIDIRGVGDAAWTTPARPKYGDNKALATDFSQGLQKIPYAKTIFKSDLSFINFEAVVGEFCDHIRPTVSWYFLSHPKNIQALHNYGFNLFSLANNHSQDCQSGRSDKKGSVQKHGPLMTLESFNNFPQAESILYAGVGNEKVHSSNPFLVQEKFIKIKSREYKVAFASVGIFSWNIPNAATVQKNNFKNDKGLMEIMFPSFDQSQADIKILSLHTQDRSGHNKAEDWAFLKLKDIAEYFIQNHGGNVVYGHGPHTFAGIKVLQNSRHQRSVIFTSLGNFIHQGLAVKNDNYLGRVIIDPDSLDIDEIYAFPLINKKDHVQFLTPHDKTKINANFAWKKIGNDKNLLIYAAKFKQ